MKSVKKKRLRLLIFGVGSILFGFYFLLYIGKYWMQIYEKYEEKKFLTHQLITLKEEEEALKVDVEKLKDPDYVARYAREKYLYSKDGEFIIRIPN
ncbi:MAG: septum formation initiator family protein [Bacilli bacterium]